MIAWLLAALIVAPAAFAQDAQPAAGPVLKAVYTDNPPPPVRPVRVAGKTAASCANVSVTYDGFSSQAEDAFRYAVELWEEHVCSPVTVNVQANWTSLSSGVLGSAYANGAYANFSGAPLADTFYPVPLAEALHTSDLNSGSVDIVTNFNSTFDADSDGELDWYYGTDGNTPFDKWDLVSVVLHELGHGLGFSGSMKYDDGTGNDECDGTAGHGCWGSSTYPSIPYIYDHFAEDVSEVRLVNTSAYPNPSEAIGDALESGGVFFDGSETRAIHGGAPVELYAPATFDRGSSYSHLDETAFNGTASSLMTPSLTNGEAIHSAGPVTCAMFKDMGWTMGSSCVALLPVELVAFESVVDGRDVVLRWRTATETNNAGFEVQRRQDEMSWQTLGHVDGAGTTTEVQKYAYRVDELAPGRYHFRLKQTDFDGAFEYSPEVEVAIAVPGTHHLSAAYPNPFNPRTQFTLAVAHEQNVHVAVFDPLGRHVATLYEGRLEVDRPRRFSFEATDLPSGIYFVRATGETFTATRKLMLLK